MPIPDYETLMLPVLKLFGDGAVKVSDCLPSIKNQFGITDEEADRLIPSGRVTVLANRTHWARTYLAKAGLLTSPKRNHHLITPLGNIVLSEKPSTINNAYLRRFDDFSGWLDQSNGDTVDPTTPKAYTSPSDPTEQGGTPEDAMESANALLNLALQDELLAILRQISPARFERLILDLLNAMGYGGGTLASSTLTKASGDGGIDGVISEDALGLDAVYIQAKRYAAENTVGRPHIQQFIGSLTGESATKGVFVTTSDFSRDARDYLNRVQQRVVLINGQRLAQLMIQHGVGVRTRTSYIVQNIDDEYFAEGTG